MRISDWSSDVCSSDLVGNQGLARSGRRAEREGRFLSQAIDALELRCPQNAASAAELIARISEQPTLPFRVQISERAHCAVDAGLRIALGDLIKRSEERRVRKECDERFRSRGSP